MKYWIDTEFIEDDSTIDLISLGAVSEDGREFYMQNQQCHFQRASDWVRRNVLLDLAEFDLGTWSPKGGLPTNFKKPWGTRAGIASEFRFFTHTAPSTEQGKGEHHALADARWNKVAWEFLQ